ncbi:HigA family addiction module antitoxin [Corynebacterium sp.]|uniref:HigA family addiction module antitoxin n=1 Tax=Corynebacterium sp. TaxID=1720 RepID=UPI0028AD197C|nr:HigA family addiction module antitoxin [Corynebacterium sp.]
MPVHPGAVLNEQFIKETGLTPNKLAAKIGVDANLIKGVINEKKRIGPELSVQLSQLFGTPADY